MTIENSSSYPRVTEILKISDTAEGNGVYLLDVKIQFTADGEPEQVEYVSRPNDPYGVNPQIRKWMSENPDAPVHVYVPPPPPTVEETRAAMPSLTARQLRLGLVGNGISPAQVQATLDAMPAGADKEKALIEWEYATTFNRTHPLIATVGSSLGLTEAQIDTMWTAALTL
ncbi:hypothetical protein I6F11_04055 [Ensifer sp. NBAIM29]|nr:hypothetical protein [Ensifer sp. NBAIM29]